MQDNKNLQKLPSALSDEELLNLLDQNTLKVSGNTVEEFDFSLIDDELLRFISAFNLSVGKHRVSRKQLYKLYKQWSEEPISFYLFSTRLTHNYLTENEHVYTFLNIEPIEIQKLLIKKDREEGKGFLNASTIKHLNAFIACYNLQDGPHAIPMHKVYRLYERYCYNHSKKRGKKLTVQFLRKLLMLTFKHKKTKQGVFFMLNYNEREIVYAKDQKKEKQQTSQS